MRGKRLIAVITALALSACGGSADKKREDAEGFEQPAPYACRVLDFYDYTQPVPWSGEIEDSYFSDVLFAGDSRMGAMYLWGSLENAQVEYVTSLNLWMIDTMQVDNHEEDLTLMDVLSTTDKNNIYLLFGINEIRSEEKYFDSWAYEQYQSILTMLRENNPDSDIYIMSTYHPRKISNLPEPALSEHLSWVNTRLADLARQNYMYFLDLDNGMTDEEGLIREEYVGDGLHFGPTGTRALEEYIKTHVVRRSVYVKEVCE